MNKRYITLLLIVVGLVAIIAIAGIAGRHGSHSTVVRTQTVSYTTFVVKLPENGVIEIGNIWLSPRLQRSRAATEAIFLMMRRAFALGYRRLEWKCDALNAASRRAAERYGFTFEGVFRQAQVVKGRNRDNAWYSIIDGEWPLVRRALEAWLMDVNFDDAGAQRRTLTEVRSALSG